MDDWRDLRFAAAGGPAVFALVRRKHGDKASPASRCQSRTAGDCCCQSRGPGLLPIDVSLRAVAGGAPCHPVHLEHHGTWRAALPRNPGSGVVVAGTVSLDRAALPAHCCRQAQGPLVLPKCSVVLQAARRRRLIAFEGTTVTEFKARGCVASTANAAACLRWQVCAGMPACRAAACEPCS